MSFVAKLKATPDKEFFLINPPENLISLFSAHIFFAKKEQIGAIAEAKKSETGQRRIEK